MYFAIVGTSVRDRKYEASIAKTTLDVDCGVKSGWWATEVREFALVERCAATRWPQRGQRSIDKCGVSVSCCDR